MEITLSCLNIGFDLAVPHFVFPLVEPLAQFKHLARRELGDGCFDLGHISHGLWVALSGYGRFSKSIET
ncbi:MAG: hypothetical protein KDH08_10415, partial [Anaerolineae bacterium]|nr:hypothetical protein [Anaerolineae bacterium]